MKPFPRSTLNWLKHCATVASTVITGFGVLAAQAPHAEAATAVTAMSFNICGVKCRSGEINATGTNAARRILNNRVAVAFMQEICYGQYRKIKSLVEKKGYTALYAAQTSAGTCARYDRKTGTGFGVAIFVKGRMTGRTVRALPVSRGAEKRIMLGAVATIGGRKTFVAVAHTSPSAAQGLTAQLSALGGFLNTKAAAMPTILGGDLNVTPGNAALNRLYSASGGGTGRFLEMDDSSSRAAGVVTFSSTGQKIDYLFASERHFRSPRASAQATSLSDHNVYFGTVYTR